MATSKDVEFVGDVKISVAKVRGGYAVLRSSKMQIDSLDDENSDLGILTMGNLLDDSRYKVGEEIAVAQSYESIANEGGNILADMLQDETTFKKEYCGAGWTNKMFVKASLMPHRIKTTNLRVERLQDISEEDCLKEGFKLVDVNNNWGNMCSHNEYVLTYEDYLGSQQLASRNHKEAFSFLIDKTCGNGTWEKNPYVFVYDFELIK